MRLASMGEAEAAAGGGSLSVDAEGTGIAALADGGRRSAEAGKVWCAERTRTATKIEATTHAPAAAAIQIEARSWFAVGAFARCSLERTTAAAPLVLGANSTERRPAAGGGETSLARLAAATSATSLSPTSRRAMASTVRISSVSVRGRTL
jgi:hypothetical protein